MRYLGVWKGVLKCKILRDFVDVMKARYLMYEYLASNREVRKN